MEKIKKWIKNNMGLSIILILTIILVIIIGVIFIKLLVGGSSNKYGNRLEGINDVKISNKIYTGVEKEIMDSEVVESVETRLQGKIVYTTIVLKSDTSLDKAKEIATGTLDNYSEKQLKYYDFSFFLKWKGEEKDTIITGNKHHNKSEIAWIKG